MSTNYNWNEPWIVERADPYVYKHEDGTYYFTASVPAYDGICLRKANSLLELANAKEVEVWHRHETGPMSEHVWAPELHYIHGKWYLYFAAGEQEDVWKIRPYVLECEGEDPLSGNWVELGRMQPADEDEFSFRAFSLDATVFEHQGKHYMVWAEKVGVGRQISNLYIAEMESPIKLKTQQVLLTTPDYDWERVEFWVNEGAAVIKRGDKLFLTYSASSTGACYCMGMLSVSVDANLLDPTSWKKETKPVLETDYSREIYGPGHNSFTIDENGKDIMIYHARKKQDIKGNPLYDPGRHAHLMQVKWDKDNKPKFDFED